MMVSLEIPQKQEYGIMVSRVRNQHIQRLDKHLKICYYMRVHLVIPMPSFILTAIDDDGTNTTKEFTNDELKDVVDKTSDFLKGVGYVFDDLLYTVQTQEDDHVSELVKYAKQVASHTEV